MICSSPASHFLRYNLTKAQTSLCRVKFKPWGGGGGIRELFFFLSKTFITYGTANFIDNFFRRTLLTEL